MLFFCLSKPLIWFWFDSFCIHFFNTSNFVLCMCQWKYCSVFSSIYKYFLKNIFTVNKYHIIFLFFSSSQSVKHIFPSFDIKSNRSLLKCSHFIFKSVLIDVVLISVSMFLFCSIIFIKNSKMFTFIMICFTSGYSEYLITNCTIYSFNS